MWRVEHTRQHRHGIPRRAVNFVVKYVRPNKQDGQYLPEVSGGAPVMNQYLQ